MKLNNWTDKECYYVDCADAGKFALLLGPFREHEAAQNMVDSVMNYAPKLDAKAHFYAYGTVKMANGHRDGLLNGHYRKDGLWTGEALVAC